LYTKSTLQLVTTAGSGTLSVPTDAVGMRVAVLGGGGAGSGFGTVSLSSRACGGGGAGCAATQIVAAEAIAYTVGAGGGFNSGSGGANSTASFGDYSLVGTGGLVGDTSVANSTVLGSTGTGGDFNFSGGNSYGTATSKYPVSTGGAGAGPNGNGADGTQIGSTGSTYTSLGTKGSFVNDGNGWGPGGGEVGRLRTTSQSTLSVGNCSGLGLDLVNYGLVPETRGGHITQDIDPGSYYNGVLGGGGAAGGQNSGTPYGYGGGDGALLVEWFYFE